MITTVNESGSKTLVRRIWVAIFILGLVPVILFLATLFMNVIHEGDWLIYGKYEWSNWAFVISLSIGIPASVLASLVSFFGKLQLIRYSMMLLIVNLFVFGYNFCAGAVWSC